MPQVTLILSIFSRGFATELNSLINYIFGSIYKIQNIYFLKYFLCTGDWYNLLTFSQKLRVCCYGMISGVFERPQFYHLKLLQ